jgi:hypothetical protein
MTTTKSNPWRDHEGEVDDLTPWNMTESFTTIVLAYVDGFNDKTFVDYVKFVCDMFRERPAGQPFQEAMRWICMFASAKRREDFVNPRPWDDIHCGSWPQRCAHHLEVQPSHQEGEAGVARKREVQALADRSSDLLGQFGRLAPSSKKLSPALRTRESSAGPGFDLST